MAKLEKFDENPQEQLLEELRAARCVMLGTPHHHNKHMQPMTPQVDMEDQSIYFYSDSTSDLGKSVIDSAGRTHLCHIDDKYQACVTGILAVHPNPETIAKFWSPAVAAWYPGGKTDPKMLMLRFTPIDAAIWATDKSMMGFAYEVAKANLKRQVPDVGESKVVNL
ncbi:pyridoxamine 5'-phosphate oxidase family protein [Hellea sp.]|nr:pyridoxamine 5'-phosphate oxidase family protein [Hellea sp.]